MRRALLLATAIAVGGFGVELSREAVCAYLAGQSTTTTSGEMEVGATKIRVPLNHSPVSGREIAGLEEVMAQPLNSVELGSLAASLSMYLATTKLLLSAGALGYACSIYREFRQE